MATSTRPTALVTGASTGIGYELAKCCAKNGYNLIIVADEPRINDAAAELSGFGTGVEAIEADLAKREGVDKVLDKVASRRIDALLANAGRGERGSFFDQDFGAVKRVLDTNITGTLYMIQRIGQQMRSRKEGKILITGSIAGFSPGPFNAVYNASKAFIDSFSFAIREELKDHNVSVTCLMPGATETEFFERAGLKDTKLGQMKKDDPADVAEVGFRAMMEGDGDVVTGWYNKLQTAIANITPAEMLASQHRKVAEPGSGTSAQPPR
ncbi:SDR family NAD(P)-dependent oxidoreductase [Hyphomicrobium sp.]|uniref:SDR family NAD(P)-dependent oxidoreductase n=1 Tax=Hyphomicrobium sp. TaxID=82 RepID=UPI002D79B8F6|nr:SDR family NAD(P)-dependent oxidoreductase [Hyphomicrobium sp.]HET6390371.1 SDR family NAD(P)-dependent oxidoreductase [Hyphomicrobium sp.]